MKRTMAVIDGTGRVYARAEDFPPPAENEVTLAVHASLISPGTEMMLVKQRRAKPETEEKINPFGYSCAGEITAIQGDGHGLRVGMRVAAMGGGAKHADKVHVPVNLVTPLPDDVSFEQGTYACLGATALQAVIRTAPLLGEFGLVAGLGIVGNLTAQLCLLGGARVLAWEGLAGRRERARQCGIAHACDPADNAGVDAAREFAAPYGMDFAVMAFGGEATEAYRQILQVMKLSADGHRMGRITLVGGCHVTVRGGAGGGNTELRWASRTGPGYHDDAWEHGADYPAAFVPFDTQRNLREIVCLMAEKRLLVTPMTTHRIPLQQVGEAADLLLEQPDQAQGILLTKSS